MSGDINTTVRIIAAGKLRRYTNLKWYTHLTPYHIWHTHLANLCDLFKIAIGFCQSVCLLCKFKPDVVFVKGGYVSLPIGLAAASKKIPIVIHDSDVSPGLANRVLAKYATYIGTGSPVGNYPGYPADRVEFVGIPVDENLFIPLTKSARREVLGRFGFTDDHPFVVVTGGGGGSKFMNDLIVKTSPNFIQREIQVLLLTGKTYSVSKHFEDRFFRTEEFSNELADLFRAANVVVTRAGASSLSELAAARKAAILIPHPHLSGNHQEKNAEIYQKSGAAVILKQGELTADKFINTVVDIAHDFRRQKALGEALGKLAKPNALPDMSKMILKAAKAYEKRK